MIYVIRIGESYALYHVNKRVLVYNGYLFVEGYLTPVKYRGKLNYDHN